MRSALSFVFILACMLQANAEAVLNNLPVTFTMSGSKTYPTDAGGTQTGYILTIGYVGSAWLGVQFVNPGGTTDFLALQIDDFFTDNGDVLNTGHKVFYKDYNSASLTSGLRDDTITTYDASSYAYSSSKSYSLQITRYTGSNSGEDWDGNANKYSVQQICFYTSELTFDATTYSKSHYACYFYEIDNYVSKFVGQYLKNFMLNGYNTSIYGYIDGPIVANKVYIYQQVPLFSYVTPPAAIIEIGTTTGNYGQDYYAASPISSENGDYYGESVTQMFFDNDAKGFQNSGLVINHWNANTATQISGLSFTALRISFSRAVYTFDDYDKSMLSTFLFCIYLYSSGSINGAQSDKSCQVVELSPVYVQMSLANSEDKLHMMLVFLSMIVICLL